MIISKEQLDCFDAQGKPSKKLVISYVNKDKGISFFQWNVPQQELFKWVYTNEQYADPPFYVTDPLTGQPVLDENGQSKIAQWRSYDNKPVRRQPAKQLSPMRINEVLNYFGKSVDPLFEMNIPTTWFCDIETDVDDSGFPDAESARMPINTIAITKFPKTIVFGRKELSKEEQDWIQESLRTYNKITENYEFEYRYFPDEYQMIKAFVEFITPIPALSGWNFLGYDWQYIYNRCKLIGIDLSVCSPTRSFEKFRLNRKVVIDVQVPKHKIVYDYLIVYQLWDMTILVKENNTLDFVSEKVLGIKKVQHKWGFAEFYREHFKEYVFYNAVDTILVEQIDKTLKTSEIWYMLACELRIDLNTAFSTIQPTETVMCNFVYPNYKVIPEKFDKDKENGDYAGAFVWPTQPGIYKYIGGLDFASLYPSIMRQFQISPESFIKKDINYIPKEDEIKTTSGAVYKKDPNAIVPAILTTYYAKRKAAKNDRKEADQEMEDLKHILEKRKAGLNPKQIIENVI